MIYTEEQLMVRDMARQFANEKLAPNAAQWDQERTFPAEAIREMGELGLMGMVVPETYQGSATDSVSLSLIHISEPTRPY